MKRDTMQATKQAADTEYGAYGRYGTYSGCGKYPDGVEEEAAKMEIKLGMAL
jgi:hypothetical protein